MGRRRTSLLAVLLGALALVLGAALPASSRVPVLEVSLERMTYVDGAFRAESSADHVWLGFDAVRSSESAPVDVPETQTSHVVVPGPANEHFESVTVDVRWPGDLTVVMTGHHTGTADPSPVAGSANRNGRVRGRSVVWRVNDAAPDSYTFTARFNPGAFAPNLDTFVPESRVTLETRAQTGRLVLEQHVAPAYGPPEIYGGKTYAPAHHVPYPDEWVADWGYTARGNYHWSTGRVGDAEESPLRALARGSGRALNVASMSVGTTVAPTGPKVFPFLDFAYTDDFRRVTGFLHGLVTADALGEFVPFDTRPTGGTIYDGDAASFAIGMSAASVHAREKRAPANDRGALEWDWDGAWAEGWSTKDERPSPVSPRAVIEPVQMKESVVYARAVGGDVDNRDGSKAARGPRLIVELPDHEFGFIFTSGSSPADSGYRTQAGFTDDGRFFMRPTIRRGGYMLEHTTRGYFRDWQAAELVSVSLFAAYPEEEEPGVRRLFAFPAGTTGRIVAATTAGAIERFDVGPGVWEVLATPDGFELNALSRR
ncbi:MAG TPA: hypothetical protein VHN37_10150 [Actinomycetota bacterium]|nr:hypothetical protein [Actinomycetota bacterium]